MALSFGLERDGRWRQLLAATALLAGVLYLAWRWGFTLRWDTLWLGLPLVASETWALAAAALFVFECWRLTVRPSLPPVSMHSVSILIPTFNESPDVLRPTVLGALAVRHEPAPEILVLDDGCRPWVSEMCEELGCRYVVRPAPRLHAKAGNLNHVLPLLTTELVFVLDADHVPLPHALERTLGYFNDPDVAFVQSPQVFFNRGFQHPRHADNPVSNEQSLFYEVICRGKDRNNSVFWCGSSAVLRRSALASVGGVATATVVEDTHTGMLMHAAGWTSVFHDEVLAVGLAPEDVNAFLVQRGRWARGCYQLLRCCNPLVVRGLSLKQRLHYFASLTHYVEGPQRLIALSVPPLVLLTGTIPLATSSAWLFAMLFLPQLVLVPLANVTMARGRYRFTQGERYALVRAGTYTKAAQALFSSRPIAFAVTPKGIPEANPRRTIVRPPMILALCSVAGIAYQTCAQFFGLPGELPLPAFAVTVIWAGFAAGLLGWVTLWAASVRHRRLTHRFPVQLDGHYALGSPFLLPAAPCRITDLSPFGLGMSAREVPAIGERIRLALRLEGARLDLHGTIVRMHQTGEGTSTVGVAFDPLSSEAADTITRWCFQHPFGPDARSDRDAALPEREATAAAA